MRKVMMFIDGTWLYCNATRISEGQGKPEFRIDFGKLPMAMCDALFGVGNSDLVRVCVYGSYAVNHDTRDDDSVQRRKDFFDLLRSEFRHDVQAYPINFAGRSVRRAERDPDDQFAPRETIVSVGLASTMAYFASIPGAFDVALCMFGDACYRPAMGIVRRYGKRVAIASIRGACSPVFSGGTDAGHVDFEPIWVDDHAAKIELIYTEHMLECAACKQGIVTTFHPRRGQKFYCDSCRDKHAKTRENSTDDALSEDIVEGEIFRLFADRGFGFIKIDSGEQYFFHIKDLDGVRFETLKEGDEMEFLVKKEPDGDEAGAACHVRRLAV